MELLDRHKLSNRKDYLRLNSVLWWFDKRRRSTSRSGKVAACSRLSYGKPTRIEIYEFLVYVCRLTSMSENSRQPSSSFDFTNRVLVYSERSISSVHLSLVWSGSRKARLASILGSLALTTSAAYWLHLQAKQALILFAFGSIHFCSYLLANWQISDSSPWALSAW